MEVCYTTSVLKVSKEGERRGERRGKGEERERRERRREDREEGQCTFIKAAIEKGSSHSSGVMPSEMSCPNRVIVSSLPLILKIPYNFF